MSREALAHAAHGIANAMAVHPRGSRVGLTLENGAGFLAGFLGLLEAGHVAVLLETSMPQAERQQVGDELGLAGFLVDGPDTNPWTLPDDVDFSPRSGALRFDRREPSVEPGIEQEGQPRDGSILTPFLAPRGTALPGEARVIKRTSGTTGRAQGLVFDSEAILADSDRLNRAMRIGSEDAILATIPMGFSYGLGSIVMPALTAGARVLCPVPGHPFNMLCAARDANATVLPAVPALLGALARRTADESWPSSLRLVISAGAPLPTATALAFLERTGVPIRVFYGSSECGGIAWDADGTAGVEGTVGQPLPGVEITIDAQHKVCVRSASRALGCLSAAGFEATEDAPFVPGDLGKFEAGVLRLTGRESSHLSVAGRKVEPSEIENVLLQSPYIIDAVVWGESGHHDDAGDVCFAAVVPAEGSAVCIETLTSSCRDQLPSWKRPRRIREVTEIPRNARGKVPRDALREWAAKQFKGTNR